MTLFSPTPKLKPILKWAGGKSGPLSQLLQGFPNTFTRYVEPFIGGGAVFFSLDSRTPAIINDFNSELIELYETVRDTPEELMNILDAFAAQYSEEFYYGLRATVPDSKISRAARMVFLNKTNFNGLYRLNSKGIFNVPFGKRLRCPALYNKTNLIAVSRRLQLTTVCNLDFEAIINRTQPGDFVYCDPPYEPVSHSSSFTSYTANRFSQSEQTRLRDACERAAARGIIIALSNSHVPYILKLYSRWNVKTITAPRMINSKGHRRSEINEILATIGQ